MLAHVLKGGANCPAYAAYVPWILYGLWGISSNQTQLATIPGSQIKMATTMES